MNRPTSLVPCLTWVRKGVSQATPDKIQLDKEELRKLIEDAQDKLDDAEDSDDSQEENMEDDAEEDGAAAGKTTKKQKVKKQKKQNADDSDDIVDKYGLDDYDEEEENAEDSRWVGMGDVANFASSEDDPYITLKNDGDSDDEDTEIKATDNLIVCGRCEGDMSVMEVYVYNEENSQLYVHHDYLLSSFPLVMEWLNFDGYENAPGNFVALGTMDPVIEIWDLDIMESVGPVLTLGSQPKKIKKKRKKKESGTGHTQAVLDLSWNHNARHVLASASADTTVALWDLTEEKVATTLTQHTREVQCCKWHPEEQQTLLTGSFDSTVKVFDCRSAESCHKSWVVQGEVEKVVWDHHNPLHFMCCTDQGMVYCMSVLCGQCCTDQGMVYCMSVLCGQCCTDQGMVYCMSVLCGQCCTDQGMVYCMDIRQDKPLFTLAAHSQSVTGISLSSQIPGLLVTTSEDKAFNIWDIHADKPSLAFSRNLRMNELHCVGCCPEAPFVFAVGGGSREPRVWDIRESAAVRQQFLNRMPANLARECEGDDKDVANNDDDDDAVTAMKGLEMEDEEEENEAAAEAAAAAPISAKKKKKKKKKAKNLQ
ncbi:hypothetical protein ACOMHN_016551 [Nucella lapillus]